MQTPNRIVACFMVVPLPGEWRLFTKRSREERLRFLSLQRLWLEVVLLVMLTSWRDGVAAGSDLEDRLPDLDFALPRGVVVRTPDRWEIRHGGGLADWMHVAPAQIERALAHGQEVRWVFDDEFACVPAEVRQMQELLGLACCWGAETGPSES